MERMTRWFQFNRPSRIFGGDFWFQANQKAIDRLLEPAMQKLVRYYRGRHVPDESIFHTLLCNQADLRISAKITSGSPSGHTVEIIRSGSRRQTYHGSLRLVHSSRGSFGRTGLCKR